MYSKINILLFCLLALMSLSLGAQSEIELTEVDSDPKREEVQRYFGYESLLFRYLTQPYDISINVNQQGDFVDIGFLYLMFIPLLLLALAFSNKLRFLIVLGSICALWIISVSNSFIYSPSSRHKIDTHEKMSEYVQREHVSNELSSQIIGHIHHFGHKVYAPFDKLGSLVSGDKDLFTYPFLFLMFVIIGLALNFLLKEANNAVRLFLCFTYLYSFYWLLFGGGIIWYCYIMLPASLISVFALIKLLDRNKPRFAKFIRYAFYVMSFVWIVSAMSFRMAAGQSHTGKRGVGMFNPVFYEYGTGKVSEEETLDMIYPRLSSALEYINSEDTSIIYKVGTSFNYFIKNNHERVYQDYQLGTFYWLLRQSKDKNNVADVLKASKIKYLILDLNTATIDHTPDKSLTKKYNSLRSYIDDNPTFKLLATDNIIKTRATPQDKLQYSYNTVGKTHARGRYAIYEIL